ncbi:MULTISPECIES: Dabb family protein [Clostridium]|jgi:Stress responsive A/B Barrel Domain|uniref:Dabb family protein n=1 Tax=Clostridium TaxID=1485 RepID=UPI0011574CF8|nr:MULTISPECIES: Dabb family protein [Clostridium]MBS5306280.1 Dabb family protein [Clostridium sp.]MDB1933404.1 Dabb family protein [Clostridium tertium]MDB1937448.1 Dabb family protein [Clostridium tertium]MDB1943819.1 Dabb family protein [Clostridium tertium]MDB1951015.1 Dabb family protein [Clostridium tertium]
MIKHIVMWKLKENAEGNTKEINSLEIKRQIESLKERIDKVLELEVGINFEESSQSYDVVLYSTFHSKDDLNYYQNHEEHLKVVNFIKKVIEERIVVDYEV